MLKRARARTTGVVTTLAVAVAVAGTACGGREVDLPKSDDVAAPTFATVPADLTDSPQLAALPLRDTAGLPPDLPSAMASALPAAVAAVMRVEPRPERFTRVSVYDTNVFLSWVDPTTPNRSYTAVYYPGSEEQAEDELYVSGPDFDEEESYALDGVDLTIPDRLVAAIEARFDDEVVVTDVDLRVGLSYGFGLVWNLGVDDARGHLATVYADLDGAIVGVDS